MKDITRHWAREKNSTPLRSLLLFNGCLSVPMFYIGVPDILYKDVFCSVFFFWVTHISEIPAHFKEKEL